MPTRRISEQLQIHSIFPTEIFTIQANGIDNEKLARIILSMESTQESVSSFEGWKGSYALLNHEDFRWVIDFWAENLGFILNRYNFREDLHVEICNMWPNVNRPKDANKQHIHAGVNFSFIYYIKVPRDSGNLVIVDPRVMRKMTHEHHLLKNSDDPKTKENIIVPAIEGEFIIFPSYLEHYVEPNMSYEPRISISGNIVLDQHDGTEYEDEWLSASEPLMTIKTC